MWLMGPKRWSNKRRQVAPATIGEITVGSTSKAMKIWRPGMRSRNRSAIAMPSTSSIGKAITVNSTVWPIAPQRRASRNSRA